MLVYEHVFHDLAQSRSLLDCLFPVVELVESGSTEVKRRGRSGGCSDTAPSQHAHPRSILLWFEGSDLCQHWIGILVETIDAGLNSCSHPREVRLLIGCNHMNNSTRICRLITDKFIASCRREIITVCMFSLHVRGAARPSFVDN